MVAPLLATGARIVGQKVARRPSKKPTVGGMSKTPGLGRARVINGRQTIDERQRQVRYSPTNNSITRSITRRQVRDGVGVEEEDQTTPPNQPEHVQQVIQNVVGEASAWSDNLSNVILFSYLIYWYFFFLTMWMFQLSGLGLMMYEGNSFINFLSRFGPVDLVELVGFFGLILFLFGYVFGGVVIFVLTLVWLLKKRLAVDQLVIWLMLSAIPWIQIFAMVVPFLPAKKHPG